MILRRFFWLQISMHSTAPTFPQTRNMAKPLVHRSRRAWLALLAACSVLSGCDQLGIETPQKAAERQIAEAKAVGSACRHAMRAIEDCYTLNPKADKSAVFAGWREMDEYMRENKLEGVPPVVPRAPLASASAASAAEDEEEEEVIEEDAPKGAKGAKGDSAKGH